MSWKKYQLYAKWCIPGWLWMRLLEQDDIVRSHENVIKENYVPKKVNYYIAGRRENQTNAVAGGITC